MKRTAAAFLSISILSAGPVRRTSAQSLEALAPAPLQAVPLTLPSESAAPMTAAVDIEPAMSLQPLDIPLGIAVPNGPVGEARLAERSLAAAQDLRTLAGGERAGGPAASAALSRFFEGTPALHAAPEAGPELQDYLWNEKVVPSTYQGPLPRSYGGWRNRLKALRALLTAGKTFDHDGDELPPGHQLKVLHPFGSVLKIQYQGLEGHPYTGLFADRDVPGLMRFSLGAAPDSGKFIPGTGIKLFIKGHASANAVFLGEKTGVDGQQPDRNFFAQAFTNLLPKPRALANKIAAFVLGLFNRGNALEIPVDHFAARSADGTEAPSPKAPYRLLLQPVQGLGNLSDTKKDFREELADLPVGKVFDVYAMEGPDSPPVKIGEIVATSKPVASEYGDRGLFFRHRRGRPTLASIAKALVRFITN
jgi:hypothetical protein